MRLNRHDDALPRRFAFGFGALSEIEMFSCFFKPAQIDSAFLHECISRDINHLTVAGIVDESQTFRVTEQDILDFCFPPNDAPKFLELQKVQVTENLLQRFLEVSL